MLLDCAKLLAPVIKLAWPFLLSPVVELKMDDSALFGPLLLLVVWLLPLLLGCTGSIMAIVLDFWDEALILSIISRGRASLIL
jgi:hypothetical protein